MPELIYGSYGGPGQPETDDAYRWCVYCGADCWPDAEYQEHSDDCPCVTGRYPTAGEPGPAEPFACCSCDKPLNGYYRHVRIEGTPDDCPGYETVCDDCALSAFIERTP